jgi:hypothetical protein
MKRSAKLPPDGPRRAPAPAPRESQQGERRTKGERRSSAENRREYERFSPTQQPSERERRQNERRTGSH